MPAFKLFEQVGEAVPQLSIAATFYALNWHWLSEWDQVMGIVTMTLSTGSVIMGLVKGGMILNSGSYYFDDWKKFFKADIQYIYR